jgi:hypothetical protein
MIKEACVGESIGSDVGEDASNQTKNNQETRRIIGPWWWLTRTAYQNDRPEQKY